jgi:glutathione synthase/RimK-type ligase-like ATP-grasp enzyme
MILILTAPDDVHADAVEAVLDRRGAPHLRFDPASFPTAAAITVELSADGTARLVLKTSERSVDLSQVHSVWYRRPGRPAPRPDLDPSIASFVASESADLCADVWELLDATMVPGPRALVQRAQRKLTQLRLARRLGFEAPPTLVTTDPDDLLAFHAAHADLVSKQIGFTQAVKLPGPDAAIRYTLPVTPRDLTHVDAIRLCPVIVQARVPKRSELRVTVVDGEVFAVEICSQEAHRTAADWRRYDDERCVLRPYRLPIAVADRCVALTRALGLRFGAIDLVLAPDGRYVFLEINPNGQYLWTEDATGLAISAAIATLLMALDVPKRSDA